MQLQGKNVVMALSGGIACYKACEVVRLLTRAGATVRVIMTAGAQQFVTPLTLQTLSGHAVATDTFSLTQESEIGHIRLADTADCILIAPATAHVMAKMAAGLADDLLTTVLLASRAPVLIAPAMNVHMWSHPATLENLARLTARGVKTVGPGSGALACGYEGEGRLAEPEEIVEAVAAAVAAQDLVGEHVLISAGPTREAIDPVRYLSNHSSGKMGWALARGARMRGARVTLVHGPTGLAAPAGVNCVPVESARDMASALEAQFAAATVLIMAAAVADYRPSNVLDRKLKKGAANWSLALERNPDILTGLAARKRSRLVVGFAAETHAVLDEAARKLAEKRLDLIVANDVTVAGSGFGADRNQVHLLDASGLRETLPLMSKDAVAARVLDWVVARRNGTPQRGRAASTRRRSAARRSRRRSPG